MGVNFNPAQSSLRMQTLFPAVACLCLSCFSAETSDGWKIHLRSQAKLSPVPPYQDDCC